MSRGSPVVDQNFAYFQVSAANHLHLYTIDTDMWMQLPPCPHRNSALVIIDNELTAVGGRSSENSTKKLVTLRRGQWEGEFPPMFIRREYAACVSISNDNIIYIPV